MAADQRSIYTPLGRAKVVWEFPDGTMAVQFDHGGGHIFRPDELMLQTKTNPYMRPVNVKNAVR